MYLSPDFSHAAFSGAVPLGSIPLLGQTADDKPLSLTRALAIHAFLLGIPAHEVRRILSALQGGRLDSLSARDRQLVTTVQRMEAAFLRAAALGSQTPPAQPGAAGPQRSGLPLPGSAAAEEPLSNADYQAAMEQRLQDACVAGLADSPAFAGWSFLGCGQGHLVFDIGEPDVLKISREYRDTVRQSALFGQPASVPPQGAALLRVRADIEAYNGRVDRLSRHAGADHFIPERRSLAPNHPFPARILNVELDEGSGFADGEVVNLPLVLVRQPRFAFEPDALDFTLPHWYALPEFDASLDDAGYARVNRMLMLDGDTPFDADFFLRTQAGPLMPRLLHDAQGDQGLRDASVEFAIAMLDYEEEVLDFGGPLNAVLERRADGQWRYMLVGVLMENDSVVTERDGAAALRKASDGDALDWRENRNLLYFLNARRTLHAIVLASDAQHHRPLPSDLTRRDIDWSRVRQAAREGWPSQRAGDNSQLLLRLPRAPWGGATYRHAAS
jgi:hypothetical protein